MKHKNKTVYQPDHLDANRRQWDERAKIHLKSRFYNTEGFLHGDLSLMPIELKELGDVNGNSLLHLQCHFGLDTLSWTRLGAAATGVDFSKEAIHQAESLAAQLHLNTRFICSDIYELPNLLHETFDIVFTSYGVLSWLPDLRRWADIVKQFLKPGGRFYMVEVHPTAMLFDDQDVSQGLKPGYDYFGSQEPLRLDSPTSYSEDGIPLKNRVSYEWTHSLGEIVTALLDAGLQIDYLHEFPFSCYCGFPGMQKREDGYWELTEAICKNSVPLLFSLQATRSS